MTLDLGDTGKKLIQKAQILLQERGYQFFSFQDLADAVGIRKASVHHYFKTKEDLAQTMIQDYRRKLEEWFRNTDAKKLGPRESLQAYFEMFADISRNGKSVCPGGSLLLDWNNFSKAVQNELRDLIKIHRKWVSKILQEAVELKIALISTEEVPSHTLLIGSSLQGALQLARASEDPEKVLKTLFKHVERITFRGKGV